MLNPSNQPVPDFELPSTHNKTFRLSAASGKNLVIYFYPKDDTPGCTTEGQDFRDAYKEFTQFDCDIVGISRDNVKSHEKFKTKMDFPFELLSDTDESVCESVRRHEDEKHVRQAGSRHRAQHLRARRAREYCAGNGVESRYPVMSRKYWSL